VPNLGVGCPDDTCAKSGAMVPSRAVSSLLPRNRKLYYSQDNLSPASVVWHHYLHLLVRGVATAVGAGDRNCIDAPIAIA
jgi:hypothetical protein